MSRIALFCMLFVLAMSISASRRGGTRAQSEDVKLLLAHPIIGEETGEAEVQPFCLKRVPTLKAVATKEEWEAQARRIRRDVLNKVVFRGEEARRWRDYAVKAARVEWLDTVPGGPGYHIRKLRYEAVPGLWIPALLYEPENLKGKVPVVLNVNGHDSVGKAAAYKQLRCINFAKRGMLVLNVEWLGMGQLKPMPHYAMNQLDLCGSSGVAVFYLAMRRGLDILVKHPNADLARVGMAGLSGGGWQTIFLSSLDERITLANPVAGYSSFLTRAIVNRDLGDSEQTPNDLATVADYIHLTALRAPRPTLLTFNEKDDCCFRPDTGMGPLVDGAKPVFRLYGAENRLQTHINQVPGTHNFEQDNREALYRFMHEQWFPGSKNFPDAEIPSADEVKTEEQLNVPLPANNATLHSLAMQALEQTSKRRTPPPPNPSGEWRHGMRAELVKLLRAPHYEATAERIGEESRGGVRAAYWKLRMGGEWTVPAVELVRGKPKGTTLLKNDPPTPNPGGVYARLVPLSPPGLGVGGPHAGTSPTFSTLTSGTTLLFSEQGRSALAEQASRLLDAGQRVVVIDPFFFGESKIKFHAGYLYVLLMAAVGERALGIQAAQVAAAARWAQGGSAEPVTIQSEGMRSSVIARVAGALEPRSGGLLRPVGEMQTLESVIRSDWTVDQYPELFCFGLLEKFDIPHLRAMAGGSQ